MSFLDRYDVKVTEPELHKTQVRLEGEGAAVATKVYGRGVTVARTGAGVHTLTFASSPGTYVGHTWGLDATTVADVNGWTVVVTATSATVLTVTVHNELFAAADLPADTWLFLELNFERCGA